MSRAVIVDLHEILPTIDGLIDGLHKHDFQLDWTLDLAARYVGSIHYLGQGLSAFAEQTREDLWSEDGDPDTAEIERIVEGRLLVASHLHHVFMDAGLYDKEGSLELLEFNGYRGPSQRDAVFVSIYDD